MTATDKREFTHICHAFIGSILKNFNLRGYDLSYLINTIHEILNEYEEDL